MCRQRFHISRVLIKAVGILLLWVVSALPTEAARGPRQLRARHPIARRAVALKKLLNPVRQLGSLGGPLRVRKVSASLLNRRLYIRHFGHRHHQDEDNAIQNDVPAASFFVAPIVEPEERGSFVDAFEQQAFTVTFSPRSPRGPPNDSMTVSTVVCGFGDTEVTDEGRSRRPTLESRLRQ